MTAENKISVLIVDDEAHIRTLFKTVMSSMNIAVIGEAQNGEEAVAIFKAQKPDIVLLDINMPVKDGTEALKEIMAEFPEAFVVMMTSVSDMEIVEKCIDLGAAHYIRKDTPLQAIKEMIKEAWDAYNKSKGEADA